MSTKVTQINLVDEVHIMAFIEKRLEVRQWLRISKISR